MRSNALWEASMRRSKPRVLTVFGLIKIPRLFCEDCQAFALVVRGRFACCDEMTDETTDKWKRESETVEQRKGPGREEQRAQLLAQGDRCFYCDRVFGSHVRYRKRLVTLRIHWDHLVPFSFSHDNQDANFVAACQICNLMKSNMCFQTVEDARIYLRARRLNDCDDEL